METTALQIGQIVKVLDASQFQRRIWTGALTAIESHGGKLHGRVFRWPIPVPINQLVPLHKEDLQ